jgi:hypothetical protein
MASRFIHLGLVMAMVSWAQAPPRIVQEGAYWVETIEATVDGAEVRALRVSTWGDLNLRGVDGDQISYSLKKRVRAHSESEAAQVLSQFRIIATREGSVLRLQVECSMTHRVSPQLIVSAPRTLVKTLLETQGGNIAATDMDGAVVAESGGGRIEADRIQAGFYAKTVGGEIRVGSVDGTVSCFSGAGAIRADRIGGDARLETAGGEIHVNQAGGTIHVSSGGGDVHINTAAENVTAHTGGGLIEVGKAGGLVIAETGGGGIIVGEARSVRCQSVAGAIKLKGVSGPLRATTARGNILAVLMSTADFDTSFLDTSEGDITVYIPSNLAVTIKALMMRTGTTGRIISDFDEIKIEKSHQRFGPVQAEGAINGGGPILKVSAVGGTIHFRRP